MSKTKMNKDYNGETQQCFTPEPVFIAVSSGVAVDVSGCSVICFDQEADIYFNGESGTVYTGWPQSQPLQLTNHVNTMTFSVSGTLMYMSA